MKIFFTAGMFIFAGCAKTNFSPVKNTNTTLVDTSEKISDEFTINDDKPLMPVDIIFVIDNSLSMLEEQQKLATKLSYFTDSISGVDWQIGITTTDVSGGFYSTNGILVDLVFTGANSSSKILTKNTPKYEQVFLDTVTRYGTVLNCENSSVGCASGNEQPMKAIFMGIERRNSVNTGFFRPGADLVTIILSDEDEDSPTLSGLITPEKLIGFVTDIFADKRYTNYGIIYRPNDQNCMSTDIQGGRFGINIQRLVDLTGGISVSICDPDYSKSLAKIGKKVQRIAKHLKLSKIPKQDASIEVILKPPQLEITWKVVGNDLELSDIPAKGTRITVKYTKDKDANKTKKK